MGETVVVASVLAEVVGSSPSENLTSVRLASIIEMIIVCYFVYFEYVGIPFMVCSAHAIYPRDIARLPIDFIYNTDENRGKMNR